MSVELSVEWELTRVTKVHIKPAQVPLCPPQISHDLTWTRTLAAAVGSRWLTSWSMARPIPPCVYTSGMIPDSAGRALSTTSGVNLKDHISESLWSLADSVSSPKQILSSLKSLKRPCGWDYCPGLPQREVYNTEVMYVCMSVCAHNSPNH
jgi:hypothetical protein